MAAESSIKGEKGGKTMKCELCNESERPLVPPLIPGEERLCSLCSLWRKLNKLNISLVEGQYPSDDETRKKAKWVIKLIMNLHVAKQSDEEVGKFEPTDGDVQVIEALAPDLCDMLRKSSLRQFHSLLHPIHYQEEGQWDFRGTLFNVFYSQKKNLSEYLDQEERAHTLVQEILKRKSKTVYLLDGHGRMLLSIIHALIVAQKTDPESGIDPDSIHFVVVEIDRECHCFHTHFFPSKVECRHGNILDIDLKKTDMLYLNFCSIPSRIDDILFNKEEVLKWIWKRMKTMECGIMISTVIRDTRSERERQAEVVTAVGPKKGWNTKDYHLLSSGFEVCLRKEFELFNASIVSTRPPRKNNQPTNPAFEFVTWMITPEECTARENPGSLQNWFEDERITWDYHTEFCQGALVRVLTGDQKTPDGAEPDVVIKRTAQQLTLKRDNLKLSIRDWSRVHERLELVRVSEDRGSDEVMEGDSRDKASSSGISAVPMKTE